MSKFRDKLRRAFNPKLQDQIELNRSVGLKDNARMITLDQMDKLYDAYFIRLTDNHNAFIKFKDGNYWVGEGMEMSCMWTLATGEQFIKEVADKYSNLELVRLDQIIKK